MEEGDYQRPCPSPAPANSSSTPLLRDISNFKTPRRAPSQNPRFQTPSSQLFSASKKTPSPASSSFRRRPSLAPLTTRSKAAAARRLKAFELEQSQSSRKIQIKKEKSLRCLAKSITVWLNFLFENPKSCGCTPLGLDGGESGPMASAAKGKRDSWPGHGVGIDLDWRNPKRPRNCSWQASDLESLALPTSTFLRLQASLWDICSFDDLKQRMSVYLSLANCKEIFKMMNQLTKIIDEGRLKMKAHCPIVTDVGMREKAVRILMGYNPIWIRIGLYIIFGNDSLLPNANVNSEREVDFLKMIIGKQFFSHAGLAKAYAYNKLVDGLYRAGYFESLGNVILKRFLLLVLILDRAKSQTSLPIEYGIDGLDGGSPLLFTLQSKIKSSRQMISEFLSTDAMHGEGNLIAHLVIVGYKVSYEQCPLTEYEFKVMDLLEDLRDGVRLCRAIQILQHDSSIIMKVAVPSDNMKKNLANCGIALQYLTQAGVPIHDEDRMVILADDIANGDKELTLSLLWNIFVHLQLPLLIDKTILLKEIHKICQVDVDIPNNDRSMHIEMILTWIQAICKSYDIEVDSSASLVDGKAIWCLLDYYFHKELNCSCSYKVGNEANNNGSIVSGMDNTDVVQNIILSQRLMTLLGNFPEVLQISDILEYNSASSDRSVLILLVFLSSKLVVKKITDQLNFHRLLGCKCQSSERKPLSLEKWPKISKAASNQDETNDLSSKTCQTFSNDAATMTKFKAILGWWQDMAEQNCKSHQKAAASALPCSSFKENCIEIQENAATIIQSHYRRLIEHRNYLKIKTAVSFLQAVIRSWLKVKKIPSFRKISTDSIQEFSCGSLNRSQVSRRYIMFMGDRFKFLKIRRSIVHIQRSVRAWISGKQQYVGSQDSPDLVGAAIIHEVHQIKNASLKVAVQEEVEWKKKPFICKVSLDQNSAAIKIQCAFRGWLQRRIFMNQKCAIQTEFFAATIIQSCYKRLVERRNYLKIKSTVSFLQVVIRSWLKVKKISAFRKIGMVRIQEFSCVCLNQSPLSRRYIIFMADRHEFVKIRRSVVHIQQFVRAWIRGRQQLNGNRVASNIYSPYLVDAAIDEVRQKQNASHLSEETYVNDLHVRVQEEVEWKKPFICRALDQNSAAIKIQCAFRGWLKRRIFVNQKCAVLKIQIEFRCFAGRRGFQKYKIVRRSAIIIQSCIRRWLAQRKVSRLKCLSCDIQREHLLLTKAATKIQSVWRSLKYWQAYRSCQQASIEVQRFIRGKITRKKLLGSSGGLAAPHGGRIARCSRGHFQSVELTVFVYSVIKLQRWWRGVMLLNSKIKAVIFIQSHIRWWHDRQEAMRKKRCTLIQKDHFLQTKAATKIQSVWRSLKCWQAYHSCQQAAIEVQRFVRGKITRKRLLGASGALAACHGDWIARCARERFQSVELTVFMYSVIKLQRWWRGVMLLNSKIKAAVIIQSHFRGWHDRQDSLRKKHCTLIQSFWRGCMVRKKSTRQLLDLRSRMQKSATNVDDGRRIINRLLVALSELQSMKSISTILHTCATLDMATEYSQKCCEELVAAGAINNLLKLIRSVSRSIPDQEVVKHALLTLKNLSRYPHLAEALIDSQHAIETVFLELLRNKHEGFFAAVGLLKRICALKKGVKAVRGSPVHVFTPNTKPLL